MFWQVWPTGQLSAVDLGQLVERNTTLMVGQTLIFESWP